jgi:hypothetical protein
VDVEDAVRAGNQLDGAHALLELLENARRQTDSVRTRPSGDAVLDADDGRAGHRSSLLAVRSTAAPPPAAIVRAWGRGLGRMP